MPVLRSGVVTSTGYARKLRRALFAQTSGLIKQGLIKEEEAAKASGELNSLLYDILVEKMKIPRDEVIRISIEYEIVEGKIVWKLDTLKVERWRKVPDEEVERELKRALSYAPREPTYELRLLAETEGGDLAYLVISEGREVGALLVTPLDDKEIIVRGALLQPRPLLIKRTVIAVEAPSQLSYEALKPAIEKGVECSEAEAEKVIREIKVLAE